MPAIQGLPQLAETCRQELRHVRLGRVSLTHQGARTMCFLFRAAMKSSQVVALSVHSSNFSAAFWYMSACAVREL